MDVVLQKQFEDVHDEVNEAKGLSTDLRDQLHAVLYVTQKAANGAPDKIQAMSEALAMWIIFGARREVRSPEESRKEIAAGIAAHVDSCNLRYAVEQGKVASDAGPSRTDLREMGWREVGKMAVLRSPISLAIIACALILKGFGGSLIAILTGLTP